MVDWLENKDVKIRKEQGCFGCGRKFTKGTILRYSKIVDGGEFKSSYWCPVCNEYWNKCMEYGDETGLGELKSEDPEGWEATRLRLETELLK